MSEIIHKTQPIEHWIVDGKAYRLATEQDVGKTVYRSDVSIKQAMEARQEQLVSVCVSNEFRFVCRGLCWRYAYIQDDSLLQPKMEHVVDCVTVEQRIAERILDDKAMKQAEPTVPKPIDWTKPVRTKDGRAVRVVCTDAPGTHPIIGIVEGVREPFCWEITGVYEQGLELGIELENVPRRIHREYWVNVYDDLHISKLHETKDDAVRMRAPLQPCRACVKIIIDCEEGEGL